MANRPISTLCAVLIGAGAVCANCCAESRSCKNSQLHIQCLDEGVYFGAAPKHDADFAKLRQLGVRRVIDIRTFKLFASAIESRRASRYGMTFQRIPTGFFPTRTGTVPRIMAQLKIADCGGVYFHCNLGSDRAGMIAAIYKAEVLGWDSQHAFADWKSDQFNPRLKDLDRYYWQHVGR